MSRCQPSHASKAAPLTRLQTCPPGTRCQKPPMLPAWPLQADWLPSPHRYTALQCFLGCPTLFSQMPYKVFSDVFSDALQSFLRCPTKFSRMPYKVFSDALQSFLGCPTKFSRMPRQRNILNAHWGLKRCSEHAELMCCI